MSDIYNQLAENIKEIDKKSKMAKDLVDLSRAAGEDTVKLESQLQQLNLKTDKWRNALREKGNIDIPKPY